MCTTWSILPDRQHLCSVDAIGLRQREKAMRVLHELLEPGAAPAYLLTMIERQFRILLQVKDMQTRGCSLAEMQKTLAIRHSFHH